MSKSTSINLLESNDVIKAKQLKHIGLNGKALDLVDTISLGPYGTFEQKANKIIRELFTYIGGDVKNVADKDICEQNKDLIGEAAMYLILDIMGNTPKASRTSIMRMKKAKNLNTNVYWSIEENNDYIEVVEVALKQLIHCTYTNIDINDEYISLSLDSSEDGVIYERSITNIGKVDISDLPWWIALCRNAIKNIVFFYNDEDDRVVLDKTPAYPIFYVSKQSLPNWNNLYNTLYVLATYGTMGY